MTRLGRPFMVVLVSLASTALVGCGEEDISDEAYGFIDLAPWFYDGSNVGNPVRGLPRNLKPIPGWNNGVRAEYYDFGLINHSKRRNTTNYSQINEPDFAYVHPMYFFFDSAGKPLLSAPARDNRTAQWYIRGGQDVLNPNPMAAPRDTKGYNNYYAQPYSVRIRRTLTDKDRGNSDDYQRPIIDKLNNDGQYSGLWEIVEVTVKDSAYLPDDIKSWDTLKKGIDLGKYTQRRTTKVINCPMVDDRTYVTPSAMAYGVPRPRMEVWYRTKMGSCYLIHGMETLAELDDDGNFVRYYRAGSRNDALRLDTFDVIRYKVGDEKNNFQTVTVPVGRVYTPRVTISTMNPSQNNYELRYFGDDLTVARPRRFPEDPPGYSPIVWHWDINVAQDPPYQPGQFQNLEQIDPSMLGSRGGVFTRNYPLIGVAVPCGGPAGSGRDNECPVGTECNLYPGDPAILTSDPPPGKTMFDVLIEREGGPRCDIPSVGYGQYCAPGVARCRIQNPAGSPEETMLKKAAKDGGPGISAAAGPTASIPGDKKDLYARYGYTANISGFGFNCHPPEGGYCYIRCDNAASKSEPGKEIDLMVPNPRNPKKLEPFKNRFVSDSRCGGEAMLGYRCRGSGNDKSRVCLRECNGRLTQSQNDAICAEPLPAPVDLGVKDVTGEFDLPKDTFPGQQCINSSGATACKWDPGFEPRDPKKWPGE